MADKRISDLNLHTTLELSDSLPIINNGETKKTTYGSLYYGIRDGVVSGSQQISDLGFITGVLDVDNYVTTSSYNTDSASFDQRIINATNEQDLSRFATTGSNTFNGDEIISGSLFISGATEFGGDLVPKTAKGATLGTIERPFSDIFVSSGSIYIASDVVGEPSTNLSNVSGNILISAGGMQLLGTGSFNAPTASFSYVSGGVFYTDLGETLNQFSSSLDTRIKAATNEQSFNGLISSSRQLDGTFINNLSGSFTGSFKGDVVGSLTGTAQYASNVAVVTTGTITDSTLYPVFTTNSASNAQNALRNHPSGTFYYDGITRKLYAESFVGSIEANNGIVSGSSQISALGFATTGSNTFVGNQTITGSFLVTGSTTQIGNNTLHGDTLLSGSIGIVGNSTLTGSFLVSGSTTQIGNNTLLGNTQLYGSIDVSGSTNFHNHTIIMTGSMYTSGSQTITGSLDIKGNVNIASGSEFYLAGNKLFNYGQFSDTTIQSGSANTAYSMKLNTTDFAHNVSITNGGKITVANTGIYNLQFSAQLTNTANTNIGFDIWLAYTGSNVANSTTQIDVNKSAGQVGRSVAAWNWMLPIQANDYVEIMWSCNDSTGQIYSIGTQTNPTRPAIPSVIATLTQIG